MSVPQVKLYGYATSPYVMKVVTFLEYKAVPYDFVHVRPRSRDQIRFSKQNRVPLLKIGDEWRTESSDLGQWLDRVFADKPLLSIDAKIRREQLRLDAWVSDRLIPARFREVIDWFNYFAGFRNGWKMAQIIHHSTPIPIHWRTLWPLLVQRAPFIWRLVREHVDRRRPLDAMWADILDELEDHIGEGPFMGGFSAPSLADFSAYVVLIYGWLYGLEALNPWLDRPEIMDWMQRVQYQLPDHFLPVPENFILRDYPF